VQVTVYPEAEAMVSEYLSGTGNFIPDLDMRGEMSHPGKLTLPGSSCYD